MLKKHLLIVVFAIIALQSRAQFLMDMVDTTSGTGKGLSVVRKYDYLKFSGYIQPQFQLAQDEGINTYEGGVNFGSRVSNRFMLRRSRVRMDYVHFKDDGPGMQFVFQFDVNERRITVRDVWGRIFENKFKLFSLTTGMFARPFGFETNYSSSDRESPERGRMNQVLMKSERDLGVMVSFDSKREKYALNFLKVDVGVFNGQGINAEGEFDNAKDIIARVALKPAKLNKSVTLSGGGSVLYGGLENNTKYHYTTGEEAGVKKQLVDSSVNNIGKVSPRKYYGADVQLKIDNGKKLFTELRGEFIAGTQTGTANNNETPSELQTGSDGFYARKFNGAYFYILQHIFSPKHQLLVKYDWYDPNTNVKGKEIGAAGSNFSGADVKYNTLGIGYVYNITPTVKSTLYYSKVRNESTDLSGFTEDIKDDLLTIRLQFRF